MNANFLQTAEALDLTQEEIKTLVKNSFEYSLLSDDEKQKYLIQVENFE
jgi:adenosine deaminase